MNESDKFKMPKFSVNRSIDVSLNTTETYDTRALGNLSSVQGSINTGKLYVAIKGRNKGWAAVRFEDPSDNPLK